VAHGNLGTRPVPGNNVVPTQVLIQLTYGYWKYVPNIISALDNDDTMIYATV
jgi:hypothetical protein